MYFYFAAILLAASVAIPQSATIVAVPSQVSGDDKIGNVKVVFTDGHSEMWTKLGECEMPKVSSTGLVGWVRVVGRNDRGYPIDPLVRICWPDGRHKDFSSDDAYIFVEMWNFADNDEALVIKSRGAHGAASYLKYDIKTGAKIGYAHGLFGKDLPLWAQPFSD